MSCPSPLWDYVVGWIWKITQFATYSLTIGDTNQCKSYSKYHFIKHFFIFHWHYYQYRNKIPLKRENTAMLYQQETAQLSTQHVARKKKIDFHRICFSYSVELLYLTCNKKALGKIKTLTYLTNVQNNITLNGPCVALVSWLTLCAPLQHFRRWHPYNDADLAVSRLGY